MYWGLRLDDIAHLCLLCRQLHDIAVSVLYHSVSVNVDHWKKAHLDCFLSQGHRGHKYVRSLYIDSTELKSEVIALKAAKDAIHVLPKNGLQSFRYVQPQADHADQWRLSRKRFCLR